MKNKIILLSIIIIAVALFFVFDLGQYLSLESLKSNRDRLHTFYEANEVIMIAAFIGVYIVTVALSLPGATILTLCAGAIFGSVTGTLVVNVGATIGATLAFLVARFLLRDWVEKKFGEKLKPFNEGFSKNAINYMLFLRLVPLFPFFLINLVSGLTQIRCSAPCRVRSCTPMPGATWRRSINSAISPRPKCWAHLLCSACSHSSPPYTHSSSRRKTLRLNPIISNRKVKI
jgi:uncharacterized membrane protein YdjX (TVP38/TMEM64 family)